MPYNLPANRRGHKHQQNQQAWEAANAPHITAERARADRLAHEVNYYAGFLVVAPLREKDKNNRGPLIDSHNDKRGFVLAHTQHKAGPGAKMRSNIFRRNQVNHNDVSFQAGHAPHALWNGLPYRAMNWQEDGAPVRGLLIPGDQAWKKYPATADANFYLQSLEWYPNVYDPRRTVRHDAYKLRDAARLRGDALIIPTSDGGSLFWDPARRPAPVEPHWTYDQTQAAKAKAHFDIRPDQAMGFTEIDEMGSNKKDNWMAVNLSMLHLAVLNRVNDYNIQAVANGDAQIPII